jgi:hypothetical protein
MKPGDYYYVLCIVASVNNLLSLNPSGVLPFLNSPLVPVLGRTLELSMSLLNTPSHENENVQEIFVFICMIEKYVIEMKRNKKRLAEIGVKYVSMCIYNIAAFSCDSLGFGKRNEMRSAFEENNKLNRMIDLCKYLISQPPSSLEQRHITNGISSAIYCLLKSERLTPSFCSIFQLIKEFKTSSPHTSGSDILLRDKLT